MTNNQRKQSVDSERLSLLTRVRLNQRIQSAEQLLSEDELKAFRKLSPSKKREVFQNKLRNKVIEAIDAEIVDYFKQINTND